MGLIGTLAIGIAGDLRDLDKSFKSASDQVTQFGARMQKVGEGIASAGKKMTAAVTLPLVGLATVAVKAAMDLEATQAKYETVFKGMTDASDKFIEEFQKLTPATKAEARNMASGMQDLLVPLGFARNEATKMSGEFMHVTGALANFNSGTHTAAQVAAAMQSAITGEYQSLKGLGIQLDATTVQRKAMEMGLITHKDQMNKQIAAQVLLAEVYAQSGDALAAYNEESLDTKTKFLLLLKSATDVAATFGDHLLPALNAIVGKGREFVDRLGAMDESQRKLVLSIGAVVAAAGPLLFVTGKLVATTGMITSAFGSAMPIITSLAGSTGALGTAAAALGVSIGALVGIVAGVVAAFVAIGIAIAQLWQENEEFRTNVTAIWNDISSSLKAIADKIKAFFKELNTFLGGFGADFKALWDAFKANVKEATEAIMSIVALFLNLLEGDWKGAWENIKDITKNLTTIIGNLVKFFGDLVVGLIKAMVAAVIEAIKKWALDMVQQVTDMVARIKEKVVEFANAGLELAKAMIDGIVNGIKAGAMWVVNAVSDMARNAMNAAKDMLGINSPSKVFMEIGEDLNKGLSIGIDKSAYRAIESIKSVAGGIVSTAQPAMAGGTTYGASHNTFYITANNWRDFERELNRRGVRL